MTRKLCVFCLGGQVLDCSETSLPWHAAALCHACPHPIIWHSHEALAPPITSYPSLRSPPLVLSPPTLKQLPLEPCSVCPSNRHLTRRQTRRHDSSEYTRKAWLRLKDLDNHPLLSISDSKASSTSLPADSFRDSRGLIYAIGSSERRKRSSDIWLENVA